MALSKSLICSQAAYHLGLSGFTDVEGETSDSAVAINRVYDWAVDIVLREHHWNFALKRAILATESTAPAWGFAYNATLPSDFIREVRINLNGSPYKVEAGKILSNESVIKLLYVRREDNVGMYTPDFADCLALQLAIRACTALTRDDAKKEALQQQYTKTLIKAKRADASEGEPEHLIVEGYPEGNLSYFYGTETE